MKDRVTIEDLLRRKRSFFASYEVNVDLWDAKNFDPEVDFFDLEDMLASRYWLKHLEAAGQLTPEEIAKLHELERKFEQLGIPEFVKNRFPAIYDKWIKWSSVGFWEKVILVLSTQLLNEFQTSDKLRGLIGKGKPIKLHWGRRKDESKKFRPIAA